MASERRRLIQRVQDGTLANNLSATWRNLIADVSEQLMSKMSGKISIHVNASDFDKKFCELRPPEVRRTCEIARLSTRMDKSVSFLMQCDEHFEKSVSQRMHTLLDELVVALQRIYEPSRSAAVYADATVVIAQDIVTICIFANIA